MLGTLKKTLQQKNTYAFLAVFLLVALMLSLPTIALAQESTTSSTAGSVGFKAYAFLYNILIGLGGLVAFIGGYMLDNSIVILVSGMGGLMEGNIGVAVNQLWVIVRDMFNIVFIFALIALGIQTILKSDDANTQRAIGYLIIAALLINFSLFFTKTVIDFSNITAHQIVKAMGPLTGSSQGELTTGVGDSGDFFSDIFTNNSIEGGVSAAFMDRMRLSSYAGKGQFEINEDNLGLRSVMFAFLMMFLMIIAGFVFAAGALLLISRFIILIILMIFSPVIFLGWIYPAFSKHSQHYMDMLLKNAFVAPAYLFMLFLSLRVLSSMGYGGSSGVGTLTNVLDSGGFKSGVFVLILYFAIIAGFLIASVIVAKSMSASGSSMAMKITNKGVRTAGAVAFGTPGYAGRLALGSRAQSLANNQTRLNRAANVDGQYGAINSWLARRELQAARGVAGSSFDVRSVIGDKGKIKVGGETIDLKPQKGGYAGALEETAKQQVEYAKKLGENKTAVAELTATYDSQIALAEEALEAKKESMAADAEITKLQADANRYRSQLAAATTDADRERIISLLSPINDTIKEAQQKYGVATAEKAVDDLKAEKATSIKAAKTSRQRSYANTLKKSSVTWANGGLRFHSENQAAAAAIEKEITKGKDKELLDALKKATKEDKS